MTQRSTFRYFKASPEITRLAVILYIRYSLLIRSVEDLLHERGIDVSHATMRFWWQRFAPYFASEIRKRRTESIPVQPLPMVPRRDRCEALSD